MTSLASWEMTGSGAVRKAEKHRETPLCLERDPWENAGPTSRARGSWRPGTAERAGRGLERRAARPGGPGPGKGWTVRLREPARWVSTGENDCGRNIVSKLEGREAVRLAELPSCTGGGEHRYRLHNVAIISLGGGEAGRGPSVLGWKVGEEGNLT